MDTKQKAFDPKSRHDRRETYSIPKLKEFGPVGVLTQAGSDMGSEMGTGNMMMPQIMSML